MCVQQVLDLEPCMIEKNSNNNCGNGVDVQTKWSTICQCFIVSLKQETMEMEMFKIWFVSRQVGLRQLCKCSLDKQSSLSSLWKIKDNEVWYDVVAVKVHHADTTFDSGWLNQGK